MKRQYRECSYDVWGNEKDGYEVNDVFPGRLVTIDDEKDLVKEFRKVGLLKKGVRSSRVQIDGESDYTLYVTDNKTGRPEFELRCEPQE
jgi:hypothetical protein